MKWRCVLTGLTLGLLLVGDGAKEVLAADQDGPIDKSRLTPPVITHDGPVRGFVAGGINHYWGIPYAKPPVGDLRWRAPELPVPWKEPFLALEHGPSCPQVLSPYNHDDPHSSSDFFGPEGTLGEDCLRVDIYAPDDGKSNHPVMFWMFGGGYQVGSAGQTIYHADGLSRHGVVVVVVNYRLGIFGFLAHPLLTAESPHKSSGNYAMLDQVAALQWVKGNIAGFGGDPNCITIFGQSVGGVSVYALMASPLTKNLFQRAIIHSGTLPPQLRDMNEDTKAGPSLYDRGEEFARKLGVAGAKDELAAMRAKPWQEVLKAGELQGGAVGGGTLACLGVDDYFLPESPAAVFAAGKQANIPIMIGNVKSEGTFFEEAVNIQSLDQYLRLMKQKFGDRLPEALKFYPASNKAEAVESFTRMETDEMLMIDRFGSNAMAKIGAPVHVFHFERMIPWEANSWRKCFHGSELPYVFGSFWKDLDYTAADRTLSETMIKFWCNFAATGDPNGPGLPNWPAYNVESQQRIVLDDPIRTEGPVRVKEVNFLSQFYLPQ